MSTSRRYQITACHETRKQSRDRALKEEYTSDSLRQELASPDGVITPSPHPQWIHPCRNYKMNEIFTYGIT